jgi:hypothetical protein
MHATALNCGSGFETNPAAACVTGDGAPGRQGSPVIETPGRRARAWELALVAEGGFEPPTKGL